MDGPFAIAETYIRIEDAAPTSRTLERRAAQLEEYARSVGLEVFGHGFSLEVLVEPGSIIERCIVYVGLAGTIVTVLTADYGKGRENVEALYQSSIAFSDKIIAKIVPDRHEGPNDDDTDTHFSAVTTRRRTLTLGKLKRSLDAAKDLQADPKSKKLLIEFQRRLSLLLADCDSEEERTQFIGILEQDEASRKALMEGFGKNYASLAQYPPDASQYAPRQHDKTGSSPSAGRKRLTAAERRALPKAVVRRFSI